MFHILKIYINKLYICRSPFWVIICSIQESFVQLSIFAMCQDFGGPRVFPGLIIGESQKWVEEAMRKRHVLLKSTEEHFYGCYRQ